MSAGPLECEVVETRTGAPAIRDRITGELMHPVVGPLVEAEQLYVRPSKLEARLRAGDTDRPLCVLDIGLGAGSNAIAAWRLSESLPTNSRRLELLSFDRSVAALELALAPENAAGFGLDGAAGVAARAMLTQGRCETGRTTWRLHAGELLPGLALQPDAIADIVFWDPFSPRANPELWTLAAFRALRRLCRAGATVHTYSGATAVRTAMLLAGFAVGTRNDVGELKQNTCAAVDLRDLDAPLDARFLDRLTRSTAAFPGDAPPSALDQLRALAQLTGPLPKRQERR